MQPRHMKLSLKCKWPISVSAVCNTGQANVEISEGRNGPQQLEMHLLHDAVNTGKGDDAMPSILLGLGDNGILETRRLSLRIWSAQSVE